MPVSHPSLVLINLTPNPLPSLVSGPEPCYINNCFPSQPSALAQDEDFAKELWQQSVSFLERLCGQELSFKY